MMDKKLEKETVKEVLTTSSFEYTNDIQRKLISEKGKTNLSFGMRCFTWLTLSSLLILVLNVVALNSRIKKGSKGIAFETLTEIYNYEIKLDNRIDEEVKRFKDPILVQKLNDNPKKILSILLNVQSEYNTAYFIKVNGDVFGVDKAGNSESLGDSETYNQLLSLLVKPKDKVKTDSWFYEKSIGEYRKLSGYKVYNPDGSLNGVVAYTNAITKPLTMITNIHSNVKEMKIYIFDSNQELLYTNNENKEAIDSVIEKTIFIEESKSGLIWDNRKDVTHTQTEQVEKETNNNIGNFVAQFAKSVGTGIKKVSANNVVTFTHPQTGYIVCLDYNIIVHEISRNLIFFYTAAMCLVLLVLYVMTYFYKYTKKHAIAMFKTVSFGMIMVVLVSIIFQIISFTISSTNMAKVEGSILEDAVATNVTPEQYIEYVALVNNIDLDTEFEEKKKTIALDMPPYYETFGIEKLKIDFYTSPSYISAGAKQDIKNNGVYFKVKKSGSERYLDFESITESSVRGQKIWIKVSGHIETKIQTIFDSMIAHFGEFDGYEVIIGDKVYQLDNNSKYYVQVPESSFKGLKTSRSNSIEIEKGLIKTRTKIQFMGYSLIISYSNYDIALVFLIVAIAMVLFIGMYFNIVFTINSTDDEDTQDSKYKHLLAEWLSGNITIINENAKDKETEYDQILLERLRKTNIERLKSTRKESSNTVSNDAEEDETYSRVKKEKDVFGISLFKMRRAKISDVASKAESFETADPGEIIELKESVVSQIQNQDEENKEIFDVEKLKVAEERLAIKQVLGEMEEKKGENGDDEVEVEADDSQSFAEELELSSKDEKLDQKNK